MSVTSSQPLTNAQRRGVAMAEFAIALPLFMLMTMALLGIARGVMVRQIMVNAAREGARMAVVPGANASTIVSAIDAYLVRGSINAPTKTVKLLDSSDNPITNLSLLKSKDLIKLEVAVPYSEVAWGYLKMNTTLKTIVVMRKE